MNKTTSTTLSTAPCSRCKWRGDYGTTKHPIYACAHPEAKDHFRLLAELYADRIHPTEYDEVFPFIAAAQAGATGFCSLPDSAT